MKRICTGPLEFAPHRPWTPERRVAARAREIARLALTRPPLKRAPRVFSVPSEPTPEQIAQAVTVTRSVGPSAGGKAPARAIETRHAIPLAMAAEPEESVLRPYHGMRVRVNETFPYGYHGRTGEVIGWGNGGREQWLKVVFDDGPSTHAAQWHRDYFDPI